MNILIHTWWFSKNRGSEFSAAYNFVKEMSVRHHLYVLVESNSYAWNDLSEFIGGGYDKMTNVEFISLPYKNRFLQFFCKGALSYVLFKRWEKNVYRYLKHNGILDRIDLIHYASPVGYRANTTIIWEALENCVPVMTVDHCGMADVINDGVNGIKIPVAKYSSMRGEFAKRLDDVFENSERILQLAKNIKKTSHGFSQEVRMDFFEECYRDAIEIHDSKNYGENNP